MKYQLLLTSLFMTALSAYASDASEPPTLSDDRDASKYRRPLLRNISRQRKKLWQTK